MNDPLETTGDRAVPDRPGPALPGRRLLMAAHIAGGCFSNRDVLGCYSNREILWPSGVLTDEQLQHLAFHVVRVADAILARLDATATPPSDPREIADVRTRESPLP